MKPSMARRSGTVTAVDVPFEDWRFGFFRRGFFNTGIWLVPVELRRLADHRGSAPRVNRRTHLSTVRSLYWLYSQIEGHWATIGGFCSQSTSQNFDKWALRGFHSHMAGSGQNRHLSGVSVTDGLPSIAEGQCPRTRHWQLDPYFRTKASGTATEEFVGWSIKSQALGTRIHPAVMQWRTTDRRNACRSKKARGGRRTAIPWPRRTAIALSRSSPRRVVVKPVKSREKIGPPCVGYPLQHSGPEVVRGRNLAPSLHLRLDLVGDEANAPSISGGLVSHRRVSAPASPIRRTAP